VTFIASPTTSAFASKWKPKPGDIVTFTYQGFWERIKKPKSPALQRLRPDKTWEEVVASYNENKRTVTGATLAPVFLWYLPCIPL
jgi:hypothetical protein